MHSCSGIPGKQWFLWDIPGIAGIVGRYVTGLLLQWVLWFGHLLSIQLMQLWTDMKVFS